MDPPSSDGPRLSRLEFVPGRSGEGCRVTLRLHVDSPHEEIVGALVGWALKHGRRVTRSGRAVLDVQPGAPGAATDDVSTTLSLGSAGTYWYQAQVRDRVGRPSNVLEELIVVDPIRPGEAPRCS